MENTQEQQPSLVIQIRAVINKFLKEERLQPKLDKLKEGDDEKRQQLLEAHKPENWIPDAAHRAGQIQQITHALKYIHPDAKGTNLNKQGNPEAGNLLIGTHTLAECSPDIVGNAAALDVYKFLRLKVDGKTLLSRAIADDPSLQAAFSSDSEKAKEWATAFANITNSKGDPSSHKLAKQLYWPLGDNNYHLIAPLFPTSLIHQVWTTIRKDRFSEEAKAAREAKRANKEHPHGYREYPNLVIQKYGGTKPQNISQLNSERYGENCLLSSCPPNWKSAPIRPPLGVDSVFDGWFNRRARVRELIRILRDYLYSVQHVNNIRIRDKRAELVAYLVDEMLIFAAELQDLDANWTQHEDCRLNSDEQCWFDPGRTKTDEEFSLTYTWGGWKEAVCKRFSNWLNAQLTPTKKPLPFGEDEAVKWQTDLNKELQMLRMEVDSYE